MPADMDSRTPACDWISSTIQSPTRCPPDQRPLEAAYRKHLWEVFGIEFTALLTITNMPIRGFDAWLIRQGRREDYLQRLADAFNRENLAGVMCRDMMSVGWDGWLFDCDFNQMLELDVVGGSRTVWNVSSFADLAGASIRTADHCFGCTAGAGSSCGGALTGQ